MPIATRELVPQSPVEVRPEKFAQHKPMRVLEFMAVGAPVVVLDTMVDKYYFDNSIVRFFQAGDEGNLARCLLDVIRNPESRRLQAEEASRFIDKNDWASKQNECLELVDGIVASQSSR